MLDKKYIEEIKLRLASVYGNRLNSIVLYGSESRGDATQYSDIDLLVLLKEPLDYGRDLETNIKTLYPLALELGRRISAKPVSVSKYNNSECPLYQNAHNEGVVI